MGLHPIFWAGLLVLAAGWILGVPLAVAIGGLTAIAGLIVTVAGKPPPAR